MTYVLIGSVFIYIFSSWFESMHLMVHCHRNHLLDSSVQTLGVRRAAILDGRLEVNFGHIFFPTSSPQRTVMQHNSVTRARGNL